MRLFACWRAWSGLALDIGHLVALRFIAMFVKLWFPDNLTNLCIN